MTNRIKLPAIALAATIAATGVPSTASAAPAYDVLSYGSASTGVAEAWEHGRHRDWRGDHRHGSSRVYYDEPVTRNTRVWRGNNGRYYCRKKDGTTGLIIGGAVGALLGREIDGGYDRTLGTILGAAGGALLGREVDRGGSRCR